MVATSGIGAVCFLVHAQTRSDRGRGSTGGRERESMAQKSFPSGWLAHLGHTPTPKQMPEEGTP